MLRARQLARPTAPTRVAREMLPSRIEAARRCLLDHRVIELLLLIVGSVIFFQFQFWARGTVGDTANWDYFSQLIVRGGVPYRDAVDQRLPLSGYLGAVAIMVGQPFGIRDILAIRLAYIAMGLITVALTYRIAFDYFQDRLGGVLAALVVLSLDAFAVWNSSGVESKTPMVLFGLLVLRLIQLDRPFLAGFAGMASALCWQPGLLFVGVAGLAFSRYLTRLWSRAVLAVIVGAAVPAAVTVLYFGLTGALRDLYNWNFIFNYAVYGPRKFDEGDHLVANVGAVLVEHYAEEWVYFALATVGLTLATAETGWRLMRRGRRQFVNDARRDAILIATLTYLAFCMVSFQGGRDVIPLMPSLGIFGAFAVISALRPLACVIVARGSPAASTAMRVGVLAAACLLVFTVSVADAFTRRAPSPSLADYEADVARIVARLEPGDEIFSHDAANVLVLAHLTNSDRFFFLQRYASELMDVVEPGGFDGWFERLRATRPKIVILGRRPVTRPEAFAEWLAGDYRSVKTRFFTYHVRKDAP